MSCAPEIPKKTTAAGMAIVPPSTTSANSLVAPVDSPVSVMSSFSVR